MSDAPRAAVLPRTTRNVLLAGRGRAQDGPSQESIVSRHVPNRDSRLLNARRGQAWELGRPSLPGAFALARLTSPRTAAAPKPNPASNMRPWPPARKPPRNPRDARAWRTMVAIQYRRARVTLPKVDADAGEGVVVANDG